MFYPSKTYRNYWCEVVTRSIKKPCLYVSDRKFFVEWLTANKTVYKLEIHFVRVFSVFVDILVHHMGFNEMSHMVIPRTFE